MTIIEHLHHYSELQQALLAALFQEHPIYKDSILSELPKKGIVSIDNQLWKFQRHGYGVEFIGMTSQEIIDAHTCVLDLPDGIDAWRLVLYFESQKISKISYNHISFDATDEKSIEALLLQLFNDELLLISNKELRIYQLKTNENIISLNI